MLLGSMLSETSVSLFSSHKSHMPSNGDYCTDVVHICGDKWSSSTCISDIKTCLFKLLESLSAQFFIYYTFTSMKGANFLTDLCCVLSLSVVKRIISSNHGMYSIFFLRFYLQTIPSLWNYLPRKYLTAS